MTTPATDQPAERFEFKAEIQQVLDILIHSLYTEQEIFLRELISNASDALHRYKFEALTRENVLDPDAELAIWLSADPDANTLTIRDTGIGMTQQDMIDNLGTIAHSGAKTFLKALQQQQQGGGVSSDVIGQFGVGFYAVFMVAKRVTVVSRSFDPDAEPAYWASDGQGSYEIGAADKTERGTTITIELTDDAKQFAKPYRLRQIVKAHSDFVAFPVYLEQQQAEDAGQADGQEDGQDDRERWQQINRQTALWRKSPQEVSDDEYTGFYRQLTFDPGEPLATVHLTADVPIQFYALLFIPSDNDFIRRFKGQDDYGLKLYARKVLIQDHYKELLPRYLRFVEGVVDAEDIPLNVSREAVQARPVLQKIRAALIRRITRDLERLADNDPDAYRRFFKTYGQFIKEGIASDPEHKDKFVDLLRFPSSRSENAADWVSLADYVERKKDDQQEIYYLLGDDYDVASRSAHLEYFKQHDLEVLLFTDPLDSFMLAGLDKYRDLELKNVDDADLDLPSEDSTDEAEALPKDDFKGLVTRVKSTLGERIQDVRESKILTDSPCRLVNPAGGVATNMQRMQRLLGEDYQVPKKILELNRKNELVASLSERIKQDPSDRLVDVLIEQLYENELLAEGIHPNPAEMIPRLQRLMAAASKTS